MSHHFHSFLVAGHHFQRVLYQNYRAGMIALLLGLALLLEILSRPGADSYDVSVKIEIPMLELIQLRKKTILRINL